MTIKLILSDLDGCVNSHVGAPFDLEKISHLKKALNKSGVPFTFCTGRPKPYLEAVMQMMDIKLPAISENGGIIFDPKTLRITYTNPSAFEKVQKMISVVEEKVIKGLPAFLEPSKQTTIGILPNDINDTVTTTELCKRIEEAKDIFGRDFRYNVASNVVNLLPNGVTKRIGTAFLLKMLNVAPEETLAIGDSTGDIEFMKFCGKSACPSNSTDDVKKICDHVSEFEDVDGILDILNELKQI